MRIIAAPLPGVALLAPKVFGDARGFFYESWNERTLAHLGIEARFVQDNHSRSEGPVLRGLHYQLEHPQGKLVRCIAGEIFDVVVDLRRQSASFGQWATFPLSDANKHMLWVPPGFAHGFCVVSESAEVLYKATDYWHAEDEHALLWSDPQLAIPWPLTGAPLLSGKDALGRPLAEAATYP